MLEHITTYLISLITLIGFVFCFKQLSDEKLRVNLKIIIILIIASVISTFLLYLNNSFIKNIFTMSILALMFKMMSYKSFLESLYHALVLWIYAIFLDLLIMLFVSITGLINSFNLIYIQTIFTFIMVIILYSFCSLHIIKRFTKKTINKLMSLKSYLILDILFIVMIIYISMLCFYNIDKISDIMFYIFIALIIMFVIYGTLDKHYSIKRLKEVNNLLIKNNEFFIGLEEEHRILKHNLINQLLGIKSVSDKKTKQLIDELILSYKSNYNLPNDIKKIPEGINGIIYEKFYTYSNNNITLTIDNNIKTQLIDNLRPKTFNELCESLGILIDNALEASSKSKEKIILINFWEDKNHYYLNINNTFYNQLDVDNFGNKNYTTKTGIRGIGIFSLLKRKETDLKSKIVNNYFITKIIVKKSNYY